MMRPRQHHLTLVKAFSRLLATMLCLNLVKGRQPNSIARSLLTIDAK